MVLYITIPLEEATMEKLQTLAQIPDLLLIICCVPDLGSQRTWGVLVSYTSALVHVLHRD